MTKESNFEQWNDLHEGSDIFVIGSSPQLCELTQRHIDALKNHIIIGGNLTYFKVKPNYFMTSYIPHALLALLQCHSCHLIKMNNAKETKEKLSIPGLQFITREFYDDEIGLSRYLTKERPNIITLRNQVLAMTHMALIMGAQRIIYIGIDQKNHSYFWQHDENIKTILRQDLHKIQTARFNEYYNTILYKDFFKNQYRLLSESPKNQENKPFYHDFKSLFSAYFYDLSKYNVQPIATLNDSVVHKAGAKYINLDKILKTNILVNVEFSTKNNRDAINTNCLTKDLIKSWENLYHSNECEAALLKAYKTLCMINLNKVERDAFFTLYNTFKKFNNLDANYNFASNTYNETKQAIVEKVAFALITWLLNIPSFTLKTLEEIDGSDANEYTILNIIKKHNSINYNELKIEENDLGFFVFDIATDVRLVYDFSHLFKHVKCFLTATHANKIFKEGIDRLFPNNVEILIINHNLPPLGTHNATRYQEIDNLSSDLIKCLNNIIDNSFLQDHINKFFRPMHIALEDKIFQRLNYLAYIFNYIEKISPKNTYIATGNNFWIQFLILALKECYPSIKISQIHTPLTHIEKYNYPYDHCITNTSEDCALSTDPESSILSFMQDIDNSFQIANSRSVIVAADYHPQNFRVNTFLNKSFIQTLVQHFNYVALQVRPLPLPPNKIDSIESSLNALLPNDNQGKIFTITKHLDIIKGMKNFDKRNLISIFQRITDSPFYHKILQKYNFTKIYGRSLINHCLSVFLNEDFLKCLLNGIIAKKICMQNKHNIKAILLLGAAERDLFGQALTIAAKDYKISTYAYLNFYFSRSPRYKRLIVDNIFTIDTYMYKYFTDYFKYNKDNVYLTGSHFIDSHLDKASRIKNTKNYFAELDEHSTNKFTILFATQPYIDENLKLLNILLEIAKVKKINILIKPHPGEQERTLKSYLSLIQNHNAKNMSRVTHNEDMTQLICSSNVIITYFSNVALEAAVLNKPVISYQFCETVYPVDVVEIGLAFRATSLNSLTELIDDFINKGENYKICINNQKEYLKHNTNLLKHNTSKLIADVIVSNHA